MSRSGGPALAILLACLVLAAPAFARSSVAAPMLVSSNSGGEAFSEWSSDGLASRSGRFVAFESSGDELSPLDHNGTADVYVKDLQSGRLTLASVRSNGRQSRRQVWLMDISDDGTHVAFTSTDAMFLPKPYRHPGFTESQLYVKDLTSGRVVLASCNRRGVPSKDPSRSASLTTDGSKIAFVGGRGLLPAVRTTVPQVFAKNLQTGRVHLVSAGRGGSPANGASSSPSVSGSGRWIAFSSVAENLIRHDRTPASDTWCCKDKGTDVYLADRRSHQIRLVSRSSSGRQLSRGRSPLLSSDGKFLLLEGRRVDPASTIYRVLHKDLDSGQLRVVFADHGEPAGISRHGQEVAFIARQPVSVMDVDHAPDVAVVRLTAATEDLVWTTSLLPDVLGGPDPVAHLSTNGRALTFSWVDPLVAPDTNGVEDVYLMTLPGSTP